MIVTHLTPSLIERTVYLIDASGVVDVLVPPRQPGDVGRIGNRRANVRLALIGIGLTTRMGQETTIRSIHRVLTTSIPRNMQWDLGILRPLTPRSTARTVDDPDLPDVRAKPRKRVWRDREVEQLGYDDLVNAFNAMHRLDYGLGSEPGLDGTEREQRARAIEDLVDRLLVVSTIPRTGSYFAIDETGQWAWTRGKEKGKRHLEKAIEKAAGNGAPTILEEEPLEIADIAVDEADGSTAPREQPEPPAAAKGTCLDAAWGYKTSKSGKKEVGFGFHQHTLVRVPDPGTPDSEPLLVDGFLITPANADVVEASLRLIDRVRTRMAFDMLVGDLLYTNLRADRWAVQLAARGIQQILDMRKDNHRSFGVLGGNLLHGWLHCPAADLANFPTLPERATQEEIDQHCAKVDEFQRHWAFTRKETGLGRSRTSKWGCQALDGRCGCFARGEVNVRAATMLGLPIVQPPKDWESRPCCTNRWVDFTPDPGNPDHQRKLMQRFYFGGTRWRRAYALRALVEGTFGILKNPSRQRLRRGQNRLPGLAIAHVIAAVKVAIFNEEQLRSWHARTGLGPVDHPLLKPDAPYYGFADLTKAEVEAIDAEQLRLRRTRDEVA